MVSQKVKIKNPTGLHLRPAGVLCKSAIEYSSVVTFKYGGGKNCQTEKGVGGF